MSKVLIIIGSKSDMEYAEKCQKQLNDFNIESKVEISSAHRHPEKTKEITSEAEQNGYEVIIYPVWQQLIRIYRLLASLFRLP